MLKLAGLTTAAAVNALKQLQNPTAWARLSAAEQQDAENLARQLVARQRRKIERAREEKLRRDLKNREQERQRLLESYEYFYQQAWQWAEGAALMWSDHQELLCRYLQALRDGKTFQDLIVNIPPGCGKSVNIGVIYVAWLFAHNPAERIVKVSYDEDLLTEEQGEKLKQLINSEWYQAFFGDRVQVKADRKKRWTTTAGGSVFNTTPGGKLIGRHPTFIIIDDPHSPKQALSDAERQAAIDWYDVTLSTRGAGKVHNRRQVIVMQRLHEKDLAGHAMDTGIWAKVILPMRYEPGRMRDDYGIGTDKRVKPGQLLWEAMFPEATVSRLEYRLGEHAAGQLQQRPVSAGGGVFKIDRLRYCTWDEVPIDDLIRLVMAWDKAATAGGGCYTSGVLMGLEDLEDNRIRIYVLDVIRDQWGTDDVESQIKLWGKINENQFGSHRFETVIEEEGGASGKQAATETLRNLRGMRARVVSTGGKAKPVRWQGYANAMSRGEVVIVTTRQSGARATWVRPYIDELKMVPRGEFKDQADSSSLGYHELINPPPVWLLSHAPEQDDLDSYNACKNKLCDHLAAKCSDFCCPHCEAANADGNALDASSHDRKCITRHASLYNDGLWRPAEPTPWTYGS